MREQVIIGFMEEIVKVSAPVPAKALTEASKGFKGKVPWAVARGVTGAASTVAVGLALSNTITKLKKKRNESRGTRDYIKALAPLAAVGGAVGLSKGFGEKSIEKGVAKLLKVKH